MENVKRLNKTVLTFCICVLTLCFVVFIKFDSNPDIFFMLKHGEYILTKGFTDIEPFTVHEGLSFSFEKWLTCVVTYFVYSKFGMTGLNVVSYLLLAINGIIVFKISNYVGNKQKIYPLIVTAFYVLIFNHKRPQLVSNLLLLIEFYSLDRFIQEDDKKAFFIVPLTSMLMMNIHSTMFPVFYMVIAPFFLMNSTVSNDLKFKFSFDKTKFIQLLIICLLSFGASLINPFGISSYVYMFNSYTSNIDILHISELSPFNIKMKGASLIFILFVASYFIITKINNEEHKLRYKVTYFIFLIFSLYAIRNLQYLILLGSIELLHEFRNIQIKKQAFAYLVLSLMIICATMRYNNLYSGLIYNYLDLEKEKHPYQVLIDSVDIKDTDRVYVEQNFGSYAIWKGYNVYIDGRAELYSEKVNKKKDIITEYVDIRAGLITLDEIQEIYDFDYYILYKNFALYNEISKSDDWYCLAEISDAGIFGRKEPRKNFISIGNYVANVVEADIFDTPTFQWIIDEEISCVKGKLYSGATLLADHGAQLFIESIREDTLKLWDESGIIHTYKKVDSKKGKTGEWETEDGFNVYTDYLSSLVTQVCYDDGLVWSFWEEVE